MKLPPLPSLTGALAASITLVVGVSVFYVVTAPEQAILPSQRPSQALPTVLPTPTAAETPQEASEAPDTSIPVPSAIPTLKPSSRPLQSLAPLPVPSLPEVMPSAGIPLPTPSPSFCIDLLGNVVVCVEQLP